MNPDLVICTLDDGVKLGMEFTVNTRQGLRPAGVNRPEDAPIGLIPVDAIYSPVRRVAYRVEPTRVGQVTDYDKLLLTVETNGAVTPEDAVALPPASCRTSCSSSSTSTSRSERRSRKSRRTTCRSTATCCARWTSSSCRSAGRTA